MEQFDPAMAERVWKRVQASLKQDTCAAPAPPPSIRVYTVPPEAWQKPAVRARRPANNIRATQTLPWVFWLLLLLLPGKCFA